MDVELKRKVIEKLKELLDDMDGIDDDSDLTTDEAYAAQDNIFDDYATEIWELCNGKK